MKKAFWNTREGKRILFVALIILAIVLVWLIFFADRDDVVNTPITDARPVVQVASVFDMSSDRLPLPLVGRVASQSEAMVRSEVSGEIVRLNYDVGDRISAGATVAEINNDSQRAEVLRAQGVLQAAQANLLKVQSGGGESKVLVKEAVRSAYTTADDAIRSKGDQFIERPLSNNPEIVTASSDYFLRKEAEQKRPMIRDLMNDWQQELNQLDNMSSPEALIVYVLKARANLEEIRAYFDLLSQIVVGFEPTNDLSQATIDKWLGDISAARSSVNSSLTSVITTYNNIRSQIDAAGGGEDILAAQAQVTQAEAGVLSAQAALEKTVIRSPISGQVNEVMVSLGDFVSGFDEIATIANNNALEITTYISEQDRKAISVGSRVTIEGQYDGVVTRIAPAVDAGTGKLEVVVGVNENGTLANGQSVSLEVERTDARSNIGTEDVLTIPISALKITTGGNFVFTVENERLVAHPVIVGSLLGEKIIVTEGITAAMDIVIDARGLEDGELVTVR